MTRTRRRKDAPPPALPAPAKAGPTNWVDFNVYGTSGLQHSGGFILQEKHPRLRGRLASLMYEEMSLNSATVHSVLHAMTTWLCSADWRVEPAFERHPEAAFWAETVEQNLDDMSHTWEDFIAEACGMIPYGWSLAEKVFKRRMGPSDDPTCNSRYNDGMIGWRKLDFRSQLTLDHWWFGPDQSLLGFFQRPPIGSVPAAGLGRGAGGAYCIPAAKMLLFRSSTQNANPEGMSMLRGGVNSYLRIRRFDDIEAIGVENDLVGLPMMEVPEDILDSDDPNSQQKAVNLFTSMCNMRRGALEGLLVPSSRTADDKPSGYKFSLVTTGGQRQIDINATIKRHQGDIAMSLLAEFVLVGLQKSGSLALHSDKTDVFALSLKGILGRMAAVINRFGVRQLCLLNGCPPELIPTIKHGDVSAPPLPEVAQYVFQLSQAGLLTHDVKLERKLREIGDLPQADEGALPAATPAAAATPPPPTPATPPSPTNAPAAQENDDPALTVDTGTDQTLPAAGDSNA